VAHPNNAIITTKPADPAHSATPDDDEDYEEDYDEVYDDDYDDDDDDDDNDCDDDDDALRTHGRRGATTHQPLRASCGPREKPAASRGSRHNRWERGHHPDSILTAF
jgi:hypothetical protein